MMEIMINVNEAVVAAVNRLAMAVEALAGKKEENAPVEVKEHIPYGRQIAQDFPMANVGVQQQLATQAQETPVQQTTPVTQQQVAPAQAAPVQTAPVQTTPVQQTAPIQQAAPVQPQVATTAQTYTLDDLSRAAIPLMDNGKQAQLLDLIAQFGVTSLPELPAAQYGAFATALRGLGAQI